MGGPHTSRDEGLACKDCPSPPKPGSVRCEPCGEAHNARERERRRARKAAGKCLHCERKARVVDGVRMSACSACAEYFSAAARAERAQG